MKKIINSIVLLTIVFSFTFASNLYANDAHIDSLSTINPELRKYFPRWKVCEPDLQFKIYQSFIVLGYDIDRLDQQDIQVMTAPFNPEKDTEYDVLLLQCGKESMNARDLDRDMSKITKILSGDDNYKSASKKEKVSILDYCYSMIPAEIPVKESEAEAIVDYFKHDNKGQFMSFSLFEQNLKLGESGFWIMAKTGNDEIGYPFWLAGESKIILKKPLYQNQDPSTKKIYKNLINAYLGAGFKINTGLEEGGLFDFLGTRSLNSHPKGKMNFGFDFHMPFHPDAGISFNLEIPLVDVQNDGIDQFKFAYTAVGKERILESMNGNNDIDDAIAYKEGQETYSTYVLGTTGQATLFYNFWLDKDSPENFFKFNLGLSYAEVNEYLLYPELNDSGIAESGKYFINRSEVRGLASIKNDEFMDWLYAKVEYRNQAVWPFSVSAQVSNQVLLARAYMPLFGNWLFLEAKYATPLRDALPYEKEHFFILSPVIRIAF